MLSVVCHCKLLNLQVPKECEEMAPQDKMADVPAVAEADDIPAEDQPSEMTAVVEG